MISEHHVPYGVWGGVTNDSDSIESGEVSSSSFVDLSRADEAPDLAWTISNGSPRHGNARRAERYHSTSLFLASETSSSVKKIENRMPRATVVRTTRPQDTKNGDPHTTRAMPRNFSNPERARENLRKRPYLNNDKQHGGKKIKTKKRKRMRKNKTRKS